MISEKSFHWSYKEDHLYKLYLVLHAPLLTSDKPNTTKKRSFFKDMSVFLGTKTPEQCRSHHQKQYGAYKEMGFHPLFYKFHREQYLERDLDVLEQSSRELRAYLIRHSKFLQHTPHGYRAPRSLLHLLQTLEHNWQLILKDISHKILKEKSTQTVEMEDKEVQVCLKEEEERKGEEVREESEGEEVREGGKREDRDWKHIRCSSINLLENIE